MLNSWIIRIFLICIFGIFGLYLQALEEENELSTYFGEDYQKYSKKTGRFFAKIKNK